MRDKDKFIGRECHISYKNITQDKQHICIYSGSSCWYNEYHYHKHTLLCNYRLRNQNTVVDYNSNGFWMDEGLLLHATDASHRCMMGKIKLYILHRIFSV